MPHRRDFLRTILLSSGSVYVGGLLGCGDNRSRRITHAVDLRASVMRRSSQYYHTGHAYIRDQQPVDVRRAVRESCDVAIVGAGPAGLAAAYALSKLGRRVVVIENEAQSGGAATFNSFRGLRFPLASIYFVENNSYIRELSEFAGVSPAPVPHDSLVLGGQTYYDFWSDATVSALPASGRDKDAMRRFRDYILSLKVVPPYPLPEQLNSELALLDAQSTRQFCRRFGSDFLTTLISLYTRSSMGASIDETNAYSLLNFYSGEIARGANVTRYSFEGGLGGLASALSLQLTKVHSLLNTCCVSIECGPRSVSATCIDRDGGMREITARQLILATQKFQAPRLVRDLPEAQTDAIRQIGYAPVLTVHCASQQRILEGRGFDTWYPEAGELFTDVIDSAVMGETDAQGSFIASAYCPLAPEQRSMLLDDEQVVLYARRVAEKLLDLTEGADVESVHQLYTYAWGHAMVRATVGTHNGIAQRARRSFGRLHFANTDNDCVPAFENAIAHGFRSAEKVEALLKRS